MMKYCQGPDCHRYKTKDRLRGPKGAKTYQTRRRSSFYSLGGNACSMQCERDWFNKFGQRAVDHFGRITEPKKLTEENAWRKRYRYDWDSNVGGDYQMVYYWYNTITNRQIDITREEYQTQSQPNL